LLHTDTVNLQVNQPMLRAMAQILLPDHVAPQSGQQFEELMRY
jgi:hypothetical protein